MMRLKKLPYNLTVCKVEDISAINLSTEFFFIGNVYRDTVSGCKGIEQQLGICEEVMYRIETDNFILELIPEEHQDEYQYPTNNSLRVKVSSYGFSADNYIDADELHLTYFAVELNKLYETLQGSAKLEDPYGARSYIEFIARSGGHIRVVGRINNNEAHGFEQELSFDNEIDQTYLRGFAKALFDDYGKYAE